MPFFRRKGGLWGVPLDPTQETLEISIWPRAGINPPKPPLRRKVEKNNPPFCNIQKVSVTKMYHISESPSRMYIIRTLRKVTKICHTNHNMKGMKGSRNLTHTRKGIGRVAGTLQTLQQARGSPHYIHIYFTISGP